MACRQRAKGATFFEATEGETARPMLDICWAPMLGALSVLFEGFPEGSSLCRESRNPFCIDVSHITKLVGKRL